MLHNVDGMNNKWEHLFIPFVVLSVFKKNNIPHLRKKVLPWKHLFKLYQNNEKNISRIQNDSLERDEINVCKY